MRGQGGREEAVLPASSLLLSLARAAVFGWVTRETGAAAREQGETSLQTDSLPLQGGGEYLSRQGENPILDTRISGLLLLLLPSQRFRK